jgi:hypothetical protein
MIASILLLCGALISLLMCPIITAFRDRAQPLRFNMRKTILRDRLNEDMPKSNDISKNYNAEYYKGLISNPLERDSDDSAAGRDNLTPNMKVAGVFTGLIGVLLALFFLANKDIPPPSY